MAEKITLASPRGAELVLDFVNTHAGGRAEHFDSAAGLSEWLSRTGFNDDRVTDADAATAREFRDALQILLLAHSGDEQTDNAAVAGAEQYLERISARYPLNCIVRAEGITLTGPNSGVDGAFATVLAAVADLARSSLWSRMKACRNDICREAFIDKSRNGSAIYHDAGCTSMVSMRAYRKRRKESED